MELYNIRKLRKSADLLFQQDHMMGAFALYWIISEAIFVRALVKAFWLRGVPLKEAKSFVRTLNTNAVFQCLSLATGINYRRNYSQVKGLKLYLTAQQMRNSIFHSGIVLHDKSLVHLTNFLKAYTEKPTPYWKDVMYMDPIDKTHKSLNDPLVDLRRIRRRFGAASTMNVYQHWKNNNYDRHNRDLFLKKHENDLDWREETTLQLALNADYRIFTKTQQIQKQIKPFVVERRHRD